ncbi:MAG: biotin transporter BioY [FCB group bacterium]|nr:biotin transporter BioY [FCB group bacterium]
MHKVRAAVADRFYLGELALGRRLTLMLTFNALLIASAYIQIPLPFSPVPITAQTMAVLACGLFLGPVAGSLTVLAYLVEGALGLPVFAGGTAGLVKFFGPTGGYLAGFVLAAFVVGHLSERLVSMTYTRLLIVLTCGSALIFAAGLTGLAVFAPQGNLLEVGLFPFLPGALVKIVVVASALSAYKKVRQSI